MFTRPLLQTADMGEQGALLGEASRLVDAPIDAANLRQAHALIESGSVRGKVVLAGIDPR